MKKLKWILSLILCISAFSFVGCVEDVKTQVGTTNYTLSVNRSEKTLTVGDTFRIVAVCGEESVVFESQNTEVATVSKDGIATAVSEGTAYIKITAGDQSKLCKINVVSYDYTLALSETSVLTVVGAQKKLTASYACEGVVIDGDIAWSVTDESKCTLTESANGIVFSAKEKGIYTVSATAEYAETALCTVKVMSLEAALLQTPSVSVSNGAISFSAVENAEAYLVKVDDGEWTKTTELTYTLPEENASTVYVRASAGDSCDYYDSEVAVITVE